MIKTQSFLRPFLVESFSVNNRSVSGLIYSQYGQPIDVVEYKDDLPEDNSAEVKVRMMYCPINPSDINTIQGTYPIKPPLPAAGGGEGIGRVISSKSDKFQVGDWVIPHSQMCGTWITEKTGTSEEFIKLRNDISPIAAATLALNPSSAYRMLKDYVTLQPNDVVIQNGANSAVGQAVIPIAKAMNLITVNIVRDRENIDALKAELKELGADVVLTEEELRAFQDFKKGVLAKPKLALNCVGGSSSTEIARTLDAGGVHVTYGGMSLKPVVASTASLIFKDISFRGFWISRFLKNPANHVGRLHMYEELTEMVAKGQLKPPKYQLVPMTEYKNLLNLDGFKDVKYIFDMGDN